MYKRMKVPALFMTTLIISCLFVANIRAQSCDQNFSAARDQYYNGQFESVQNMLIPCTTEFFNQKNFYLTNNQNLVFQVYKLLITSYYDSDYDYLAEERKQQLVNFFNGIYSPQDVIYRLDNTAF